MHRISTALIAAGAATFLLGCSDDDDDEAPSLEQRTLVATIAGNPGWENLSGESTVDWTPGIAQFSASIELNGDAPGAVRPWHVHFGSCSTGGAIVGPPADYPTLTIASNGSASADASIDAALDANAPYHVNVHLSPAEMGTLIACGDLGQGAGGAGGSAGAGGTGTGGAGTGGMGGAAGASGAGGTGGVGTGGAY